MKNYFYYDIFSLDDGLIDEWIENYFWPVSFDKTQQILSKTRNTF